MSEPTIHIRMYKGLLGDCFLIRCADGGKNEHILIDCGVLQGTPDAREKMIAVAEDIVEATGGDLKKKVPGKLDLLVVTHEHWDHISGFSFAKDIFFDETKLAIDRVWLAWTEKPGDTQADALRQRFAKSNKTVAMIADTVEKASAANPAFGMNAGLAFDNLQNFLGVSGGQLAADGLQLAPGGRLTGGRIMTELAKVGLASNDPVTYLEPGTETRTPGVIGLKTYVLGPPRDPEKLFKALASADDEHQNFSAPAFNDELFFHMAGVKSELASTADASPFSRRHRTITAADVQNCQRSGDSQDATWVTRDWLRSRYFDEYPRCRFGQMPPERHDCRKDMVCGSGQRRKRIDGAWLASAGALALKLDSDTNNTSLVLAFELPGNDVMLFAADAQVGNWESWADHTYDGNDLDALLGRVCFYKVGHHGSHNATRVAMGLEKMNLHAQRPLVAMIPTDETFALQQGAAGKGWKMPAQHVREALLRKTSGRTLYGDRNHGELPPVDGRTGVDPTISPFPADADFRARLDERNPLYVEYRIMGEASAPAQTAAPSRRERKPA